MLFYFKELLGARKELIVLQTVFYWLLHSMPITYMNTMQVKIDPKLVHGPLPLSTRSISSVRSTVCHFAFNLFIRLQLECCINVWI